MLRTLLQIILIFFPFCVKAQNPVHRSYNSNSGLASNTVYDILQDKNGFIWLAHEKGLTRFDAVQFKNYISQSNQSRGVSNLIEYKNKIYCQDFSGNFYFTNSDSLQSERRFYTPGIYTPAMIMNNETLISLKEDSLRLLNLESGRYESKESHFKRKQTAQNSIDGLSYFLEATTLYQYNRTSFNTIATLKKEQAYHFLIKANNNYLGISKSQWPYIYNITQQKELLILPKNLVIQNVVTIEQEIWVTTTTGAFCFDTKLNPKYNGKCFFESSSISNIIKDREGSYWFTTLNNGVLQVPNINIVLFNIQNDIISTLAYNGEGQSMLMGTASNKLLRYNTNSKKIDEIFKGGSKQEILDIYVNQQQKEILFCSDKIYQIKNNTTIPILELGAKSLVAVNNNYYASAYSTGYCLFGINNKISPNFITTSTEKDNRGNTFFKINEKSERGRSVAYDPTTQVTYIATNLGTYYIKNTKKYELLYNTYPIYASQILVAENRIFAATFNSGVFEIVNFQPKAIIGINKPVTKTAVKLSKNGDWLWVVGEDVLQKIHLETKEVIEYTISDGLPKAELKDVEVINGLVYLATSSGLVILEQDAQSENKIAPILKIDQLLINGTPVALKDNHQFSFKENNINILFSVLSFKTDAFAKVEYQINDQQWRLVEPGLRNISLYALGSGKYVIKLRAYNEDNIVSKETVLVRFTIATPLLKNPWFLAATGFFLLTLLYLYYRRRLRNEQRQNDLLSQKIKLEQQLHQSMLSSIKSQMNPHFLFNALNTIQSYIYTNEKENASIYLGKFSELTRTILDMSNKERVSLAEEIKALQLYVELEQLRFEDKLHYQFNIDKAISTETTFIPSMLIQPYVENAIKHGLMHQKNQWNLQIVFTKKELAIEVIIDDNGIGRKASEAINQQRNKRHQSFASNANEKRLDILNKGLKRAISLTMIDKIDEHGFAAGTKTILNIPFMNNS